MPRKAFVLTGHAERHIKRLKPKVLVQGDPACRHFFNIDRQIGVCKWCGEVRDYSTDEGKLIELAAIPKDQSSQEIAREDGRN